MSGRKIFTKRFFDLSHGDQAAVVDAAISDLESILGRVASEDRKGIKQRIKRITKKAAEFGIYEER